MELKTVIKIIIVTLVLQGCANSETGKTSTFPSSKKATQPTSVSSPSDSITHSEITPPANSIANSIEWKEVKVNEFITIKIPYSSSWEKAGLEIPPYEIKPYEDGSLWVYFGNYVSENGVLLSRQYALSFHEGKPVEVTGDQIKVNACGEELDDNGKVMVHLTPPEKVTIAGIAGVSYLSGGFGACSTLFQFNTGEHYITLRKTYPFGSYDPKHIISADMEEIIQQIRTIK